MGVNNFSNRLRDARKSRQFSQETLAERVGVSAKTIYKWELGEFYPELGKIPVIAQALEVRESWFFEDDEFEKKGEMTLEALSAKLDESLSRLAKIEALLEP